MKSFSEIKSAVESGFKVFCGNRGYELKKTKAGEFVIVCFNGYVSPLDEGERGHKPEDFFADSEPTNPNLPNP